MPTTITLDGVGRPGLFARIRSAARRAPRAARGIRGDDRGQWLTGVGDAWSDDAASSGTNAVADFTTSAFGWGVLAFAVGTAAIRGYTAVKKLI